MIKFLPHMSTQWLIKNFKILFSIWHNTQFGSILWLKMHVTDRLSFEESCIFADNMCNHFLEYKDLHVDSWYLDYIQQ